MDDPRFSHIATDPRFKAVPRKARKVKVDPRFNSMFTDKKFKTKYYVDKRGRKVKLSSTESIKKYYDLDKEDNDGVIDDAGQEVADTGGLDSPESKASKRVKKKKRKKASVPEKHVHEMEEDEVHQESSSDDGNDRGEIDDDACNSKEEACESSDRDSDLGDGDGDFGEGDSSISTDSELGDDIEPENEIYHNWGEVDDNVMETTDVTSRLAVCNMDWDNITVQDLYVLLSSFKPQKGMINSVTIYPSDFGKERLEKEDILGPAEIVEDELKPDLNPDSIEGKDFSREKLRQYQLNRLKYYYAIVECDSADTAGHIYDQCDGLEYEYSASKLDLRFVPEDMSFSDREAVSMATDNSVMNYKPSDFFTTALQQSSVKLTWDQTDPKRLKTTMRKFTEEDMETMAFSAYLASSSDDGGESEGRDNIESYRAMLFNGSEEADKNDIEDLQVTWDTGLNESDEAADTQLKNGRESCKKTGKRKREPQSESETEESLGFDDPFFTKDLKNPKLSKKRKNKVKLSREEEERNRKEREELELLVMSDSEDTRQHFSLKSILSEEKKESGKKKRKKRKDKVEQNEAANKSDFKIDLEDPRFSALYESHLYAIDPSNPSYKSTDGTKAIIAQRQERRKNGKLKSSKDNATLELNEKPAKDPSIGMLVKSIKSKTDKFHEKMKNRRRVKL